MALNEERLKNELEKWITKYKLAEKMAQTELVMIGPMIDEASDKAYRSFHRKFGKDAEQWEDIIREFIVLSTLETVLCYVDEVADERGFSRIIDDEDEEEVEEDLEDFLNNTIPKPKAVLN
jgi:L-lactate utilization protein LutB